MKRLRLLLALAAAVLIATAAPAGARTEDSAPDGVAGGFEMTVHTHSTRPETLLFPDIERLAFDFQEGDTFAYSSRVCSFNAPFNNLGLDFIPDYPGVDDDADGTASVRHQVAGTVTEQEGTTGKIEATITSVLCDGAVETASSIVTNFQARYELISDDALQIVGRFKISPDESTGTFADLKGRGSIEGVFTCLGAPKCADLGEFTDFVAARGDLTKGPGVLEPGLVGTFKDPTVTTG